MRIVAETVVGILLTLVLMWLLLGGLLSVNSGDPGSAFLSEAPSLMFGAFWIGLVLWGLLVVLGNVLHRNRRPGARVLHNLLSALAAALVNLVVAIVIGATAGGWAMFFVAIVLMGAIAFLAAAAIAIPVTHLVLFRAPRTPAATSPAPSVSA